MSMFPCNINQDELENRLGMIRQCTYQNVWPSLTQENEIYHKVNKIIFKILLIILI